MGIEENYFNDRQNSDEIVMLRADESEDGKNNINGERKRNKKSKPAKWKRKINQNLRMKGQKYLGYSRSKQNVVSHDVNRDCKSIRPTCTSEVLYY